MGKRSYTPQQRAEALELYRTNGPTAVERELGIPKATVSNWAKASGVGTVRNAKTAEATAAARLDWEKRRVDMAHRMGEIAELAMERVQHAIVGQDPEGGTLLVPGVFGQPTLVHPGDAKALATTMAILVDKAQLLTGAATSRHETMAPEERQAAEERLAKLIDLDAHRAA